MFLRRIRNAKHREAELIAELETHAAHDMEEMVARGIPRQEAEIMARQRIGNITLLKETVHNMNPVNLLDAFTRDLRYAARQLCMSPGFTLTAVLSLALGIGANTAIFQLLNAVQLRSLPVANPSQLAEVKILGGNKGFGVSSGPYDATNPLWEQIRDHQKAFSGIFAYGATNLPQGQGADATDARAIWLSGDAFRTLGLVPYRGRFFSNADDRRGCAAGNGIVASYETWQRGTAIGSRVILNDKPFEVIGVTPPGFFGLEVGRTFDFALLNCTLDFWGDEYDERHYWNRSVIGRLRTDWTTERASAHLEAESPAWFQAVTPTGYNARNLEPWFRFRFTAVPASNGVSGLRRTFAQPLWLLLGVTGLVVLIACANLANLLLARSSARQREIAIRLALGASRSRLIVQLLSEGTLLAGVGAVLGAVIASVLSRVLLLFLGDDGVVLDVNPDWRVFLFTAVVGVLTCILFALAPAWKASRSELGGRHTTASRHQFFLQRALISSEIGLSLILLTGALLFVRSFHNIVSIDPGFKQDGLVFHFVNLFPMKLPDERLTPAKNELLEKIKAIPGVQFASTTSQVPMSGQSWSFLIQVPGNSGKDQSSQFTWVSPQYFQTMGISLVAGRDINEHDTANSPKVVLVNQTFVAKYFAGEDPIGRAFRSLAEPGYPEMMYQIVGVVADTRYRDLRDVPPPIAYTPESQNPRVRAYATVIVRSEMPPTVVMKSVKDTLAEAFPAARMADQVAFREVVSGRLQRERMLAWLSGFFGVLAALLAMIGLYGVISYMTAKRRNEIGIRLALGCSKSQITRMVLRQLAVPLLMGVSIGVAISLAATKAAESLLYGLKPNDPATFAIATAGVAVFAIVATLIPAARAAQLNPVETLRQD